MKYIHHDEAYITCHGSQTEHIYNGEAIGPTNFHCLTKTVWKILSTNKDDKNSLHKHLMNFIITWYTIQELEKT